MAHAFESGFFVGELPWHGLGTTLAADTRLSVSEAIRIAKMDWDVYCKPLYARLRDGSYQQAPCTFGTYRSMLMDNGNGGTMEQEQWLGTVGTRYTPMQNQQAFEWFQPFLDRGEATLHTAGSLHDGRVIWVLAKLNRNPLQIVKGDEVSKFLLLSHSHDGSKAIRVGFTPIRVVCANTLAQAHGNANSKLLRFKHTPNAYQALEEVRETVNAIDAAFEATAEQYRTLCRFQINRKDLEKYIRVVLDIADNTAKGKPNTKGGNIVQQVIDRFEGGMGNALPGVKGTLWAAYNALTEYMTWNRGEVQNRTEETKKTETESASNRLASLWFGKSAKENETALQEALKMAV